MAFQPSHSSANGRALRENAVFYTGVLVATVVCWALIDLAVKAIFHIRTGTGSGASLVTGYVSSFVGGMRYRKRNGALVVTDRKRLAIIYLIIQIVASLVAAVVLIAVFGLDGMVGFKVSSIPYFVPIMIFAVVVGLALTYVVNRFGLSGAATYATRRKGALQ